jgi:subtilisin family serine protease
VSPVPAPSAPVVGPIDGTEAPTRPLYGSIDPFYGNIDPFHGTLNPFYGSIDPFWGSIDPFHGNIDPFYGNIDPFWGTIDPFYGSIDPFYGNIDPFNGAPALNTIGDYWTEFGAAWNSTESLWTNPLLGTLLTAKLNEIILRAELTWGGAVTKQSGKSFRDAFLNPLFARYAINPTNPATLRALSATKRAQFMLDWYDGLMAYAGIDRVDHWMRTVNWTPAITQQQGSGADSIIGLLDATASGDPDIADNIAWSGGYNATVSGHGVGVASLMVAAHDRKGVMGIAPNATVIAYNPFDSTGTASWAAVRQGVLSLAARNASVINMSLGVPGYTLNPDWRKIFFDPAVYDATRNRVFVMAAGNDGSTQTQNLAWDWSRDPNLIIVGSTRIDGTISDFSNRPGNACLMQGDVCRENLMDRFMVAPGELILVPDGQGGFVRRSGTSFSAPLVSGAITLLHDRWTWLANYPRETVDIILRSARDLGAPGVDAVYGHGMLDVAASQAPLNFNNLLFYESRNGVITPKSAASMVAGGVSTTWEADGVFFYMYEPIGRTFRDFAVPVSSKLVGKIGTVAGQQYFQRFITNRLTDWVKGGSSSFTDANPVEMLATPSLRVSVSGSSPEAFLIGRRGGATPHTAMRVSDVGTGIAFSAGYGSGALAFNGDEGFGLSSDHGSDGGVNPLLGLASGGPFASIDLPLGGKTRVSVGTTRQQLDRSRIEYQTDEERAAYQGMDPYEADAMNLRISHQARHNLTISGSYARIHERDALLGVQSRERSDLDRGATSETATVGASLTSGGFTFAASGTLGRTRTVGNSEQGFTTRGAGILSSAFAVSATRMGVLGKRDALRVSLAQPLHIENGELTYNSVEVIDRQTGELGTHGQGFDLRGDPRSIAAELLYATPVFAGKGEFGLFGQARANPQSNLSLNQFALGSRLAIRF